MQTRTPIRRLGLDDKDRGAPINTARVIPHHGSDPGGYRTTPVRTVPSPERATVKNLFPSASSDYATTPTGLSPYGPKHAALLARLRSLKEARLRRASAGFGRPIYSSVEDEHSCSTKSSTRFGGSTFLASLDVE